MSHESYDKNAQKLFNQYQSLTFEQVHSVWLPLLEKSSGLALARFYAPARVTPTTFK